MLGNVAAVVAASVSTSVYGKGNPAASQQLHLVFHLFISCEKECGEGRSVSYAARSSFSFSRDRDVRQVAPGISSSPCTALTVIAEKRLESSLIKLSR